MVNFKPSDEQELIRQTMADFAREVLRPGARPIDFRLRAGEIVGLAGLEGHGQATFLLALRGQGGFGGAVLPTGCALRIGTFSLPDATRDAKLS